MSEPGLTATLLGPPGPAQRRALAKAITLLESTRADHRLQADQLLNDLLPHAGRSLRLGISGVPGVGKSTFERDLEVLRPRGYLVLFGGASGPVPPFDPMLLSRKGSLFLTRPSLHHHIATREELVERAGAVLGDIAAGRLKLRISQTYGLSEAAKAHRDLEGRKTTGKLLLIPTSG